MAHVATLASFADLEPTHIALYALGPAAAILALFTALLFYKSVMRQSEGDETMVEIAQAVRDGAMAYLAQQYKVVGGVFVALIVFLALMWLLGLQASLTLVGVPIAGFLSGLCGWFGMKTATNASARTTYAAKESLDGGLRVAFRSGAVMGLVVVGFALLDVSVWFGVLNLLDAFDIRTMTTIMLSFGMGASTQALFARVGGGIYTKAADVGADLVGKVEAGIPEDDARNPATIADNVGDNVGDVAGMGADLYESYYGSILATMALGAAAAFSIAAVAAADATATALKLAIAPIALAGLGIFCSIGGVFTVRAKEGASFSKLLKSLHTGVWTASALIAVMSFLMLFVMFRGVDAINGVGLWGSIVSGLAAGLIIAFATEYSTSYEYKPTRTIAQQALTGPATVIISGIAEGMKSTWASLLTVVVAIICAFTFAGGSEHFLLGLYGVGIAAVGMLSTLGITLATDAYGPIADNAGGNAEMSGQPPHVRERTDMLDSLGNTTAATGKGFAIGSAALTALALFAAYIQVVQTQLQTQTIAYIESVDSSSYVQPEGVTVDFSKPYAVYAGHSTFGLVFPNSGEGEETRRIDGAIITDPEDIVPGVLDSLDYGMVFPLDLTTRSLAQLEEAGQVNADGTIEGGRGPVSRESQMIGASKLEVRVPGSPIEIVPTSRSQIPDVMAFYDITMLNPRVLGGIFLGVLLAFLFCALTMNAVGRAAYEMMNECRRQFGLMRSGFRAQGVSEEDIADPEKWPKKTEFEGKKYPDYANCVAISTAGAQREMVIPSLLAIVVPILIGLTLSVPGVVGMLAGGLTCGFAVAIFMANAGGAWDNAKKLLESYGRITADQMLDDPKAAELVPAAVREQIKARAQDFRDAGQGDTYVYGKGSEDHKATVVGDTVGDPFKDTSGPSLNILIKLISIVSVVFAGLTVKFGPLISDLIGLR